GLYADEQRSRLMAERLQSMTGLLSNALTRADVARVVVDEVAAAVDASSVTLLGLENGDVTGVLGWRGPGDDPPSELVGVSLEGDSPAARAIRTRRPVAIEPATEAAEMDGAGPAELLLAPLAAGRRTNALLLVAWEEPRGL